MRHTNRTNRQLASAASPDIFTFAGGDWSVRAGVQILGDSMAHVAQLDTLHRKPDAALAPDGGSSGASHLLNDTAIPAKLFTAYDLVRFALSLLLLLAAALKGHQLATSPVAETGLLTSRPFLIAVVELEVSLGLWLLFGPLQTAARKTAMGCFLAFGAVSLASAISGEERCACFGRVQIHPWWTTALDFAAVAALFAVRRSPRSLAMVKATVGLATLIAALLAICIPAAVLMASYRPSELAAGGQVIDDGQIIVLDPKTWIGKPLPILAYVNIGDRLTHGQWTLLLFHPDCPSCRKAMTYFAHNETAIGPPHLARHLAFLEVPPLAGLSSVDALIVDNTYGYLDASRDWFVATPVAVTLKDGVVLDVYTSSDISSLMSHNSHTR